jgi:hypothetical protein
MHLRESAGPNLLTFAAHVSLKEYGQTDAAKLVKNAMITPTSATKFLTTYKKVQHFAYRCERTY